MVEQSYVVFDFDGTIYKGDCSIDFYRYMIGRNKSLLIHLPMQLICFALWKLHLIRTDTFKQLYFRFLNGITPHLLDGFIQDFWRQKNNSDFNAAICDVVKSTLKEGGTCVVITASPQLIVQPLISNLFGVETIGTLLEYRGGTYFLASPNCKGVQKVIRFENNFGKTAIISAAYSDNSSDMPLFKRSIKAFKVRQSVITEL